MMLVTLITSTPNPAFIVEYAARLCHRSELGENRAAFIARVIRLGHESVLEHVNFTFEIAGISRVCSHQIVRHRLASYSQESQRHVEQSDTGFVCPDEIASRPEPLAIWEEAMQRCREAYADLLECQIRKEDARFILPQAVETRLLVTMNARELRHFLRERLAPAAQWEIRMVAAEMLRQARIAAPELFYDFMED